jgi:hypothetical protein
MRTLDLHHIQDPNLLKKPEKAPIQGDRRFGGFRKAMKKAHRGVPGGPLRKGPAGGPVGPAGSRHGYQPL